jgi:hypothetical protein
MDNHRQNKSTDIFGWLFTTGKYTRLAYWLLLVAYSSLVLYGAINHEQWRDEGNTWMAVRDLSLSDLFSWYIPVDGHPPLYFLVLFPFAKAGMPHWTVNAISVVTMIISLYLILFRVRIPVFLKCCLVFSYFILYEYAIIGRGYCLVVLVLSLIWTVYPHRFRKPWQYAFLIILLFNTENILFFLSGGLLLLYFIEMIQYKKITLQYILPLIVMGAGGLYIIPYMALRGMEQFSGKAAAMDHVLQLGRTLGGALYGETISTGVGVITFILLGLMLFRNYKGLFLFLLSSLGLIYFLSYKYTGTLRHQGLLLLSMLCGYVLAFYYTLEEEGKELPLRRQLLLIGSGILSLLLLKQTFNGFSSLSSDIAYAYSDAKNSAEFLIDNNLVEDKILIGHTAWGGSSLMQFLPKGKKMYYASCDRYGSYLKMDSLYLATQFSYNGNFGPYVAMTKFKDSLDKVILIMNLPITDPASLKEWKLIYSTTDETLDNQERYQIYRYNAVNSR